MTVRCDRNCRRSGTKKKAGPVFLLLLIGALLLSACKTTPSEEWPTPVISDGRYDLPVLTVWSAGSRYDSVGLTQLITAYNQKPDRTVNVVLQFVTPAFGEADLSGRYAAAFKAGSYEGFDIIAETGDNFADIIKGCGDEAGFLDIDFSRLSNWENVRMTPSVHQSKLVPYRGTTVAFAYDSAKVANPPRTWEELTLWIKANPGRFTYTDPNTGDTGSSFLICAMHQGTTDEGFAWLKEIHPDLYFSGGHIQYPVKDLGAVELLSSGEAWIIPAYSDNILKGISENTLPGTVKMYQMTDLALAGTDFNLGICANTPHADACYHFINFMLSTEAQQMMVESMWAVPAVDPSALEQTVAVQAIGQLDSAGFNYMKIPGEEEASYKNRWLEEIATIG